MNQMAPTAKGTLEATPLAHLLIYALDRRLVGSIVFEEPSHAKHAIYLVEGVPVQARLATPVARLGDLARERGALQAAQVDAIAARARETGRRFGEVLVERNLLEAPVLEALLREQVVRRLEFLSALPSATAYGYYEGTNFLERAGGPSEKPPAIGSIWRVIRRGVPQERLRDLLGRLGDGPLRFHPEAPLGRFEFGPKEQAVVDVLRAKPQPFAELVARGLAEPATERANRCAPWLPCSHPRRRRPPPSWLRNPRPERPLRQRSPSPPAPIPFAASSPSGSAKASNPTTRCWAFRATPRAKRSRAPSFSSRSAFTRIVYPAGSKTCASRRRACSPA
jgi:hypothetical protein